MPAFTASAPGKIILFGEHAVVYQQPGIAVPISQVHAKATVLADIQAPAGRIRIEAPDIDVVTNLDELSGQHPFRAAVDILFKHLVIEQAPAFRLKIHSSIPIAAGLGSGAAVTVAILRAVSAFLGRPLPDETISALTFEVEKLYHGTPSGIDNTVITYQRPVYYIKDKTIETFNIHTAFNLIIADTGIAYPTSISVGDVRKLWIASPEIVNPIFAAIGSISKSARYAIENGKIGHIGPLMNENHELLQELDVSCTELDTLVYAAIDAGAMGAKLSGGGRGGNMITLVEEDAIDAVNRALLAAGAVKTIVTRIKNPSK